MKLTKIALKSLGIDPPKVIFFNKISVQDVELFYAESIELVGNYDRIETYDNGGEMVGLDLNKEVVTVNM